MYIHTPAAHRRLLWALMATGLPRAQCTSEGWNANRQRVLLCVPCGVPLFVAPDGPVGLGRHAVSTTRLTCTNGPPFSAAAACGFPLGLAGILH